MRKLLRRCDGSALTEFAFAAPLFLALVLGTIEGGRLIWAYNCVAHAASEGTRFAIVRGSESGRAATSHDVAAYVQGIAVLAPVLVTTTWTPNNTPGSTVEVQVEYDFQPAVNLFPAIPLIAVSRMAISF